MHREVFHRYPQVYIVGETYRRATGNQRVPASGQLRSVLSTQTVDYMQQQLTYHDSPDPNNATRFELFPTDGVLCTVGREGYLTVFGVWRENEMGVRSSSISAKYSLQKSKNARLIAHT